MRFSEMSTRSFRGTTRTMLSRRSLPFAGSSSGGFQGSRGGAQRELPVHPRFADAAPNRYRSICALRARATPQIVQASRHNLGRCFPTQADG